jgi:hypothetical protein
MTKIHWLIPYDNLTEESIVNTNLASIRMRLGAAILSFKQTNFDISFGQNIFDADFIIIGKIGATNNNLRENLWLNQIKEQKKLGKKVILDYTDDHLNFKSPMTSFYEKSLPYVDIAIASSIFLADKLKIKTNLSVEIIPDAIEVPILKPKIKVNNFTNIFWFGHASNINYLIEFINKWTNLKQKVTLFILTNEQGLYMFNQTKFNIDKNLSLKLGLWSIETMINTSKICDFIIIPSNPDDPKKQGVSSNRLITGLALGLPVAASIMSSYKEFSQYFTDIDSEKFLELIDNPTKFHNQVYEAQDKVIPKFTKEVIGQKWIIFLRKLNKE